MNVVFDVGRVLLRWEPDLLLGPLTGGAEGLAAFHAEVDFYAWHFQQDNGRGAAEAVAAASAAHPAYAPVFEAFYERWLETIPGTVPGSVAVLERLRAREVPLYAITNFPGAEWRKTVPVYPFLDRFRDVVVSGDVGLTKPDAAIYRLLLERNGLAAGDCVFIDDSPPNVAAAKGVGMDAIHFTDAAALEAALTERGLLG
ncbi:MAG: HAD-IA family hydrolase [Pseudomonadota bacterium]